MARNLLGRLPESTDAWADEAGQRRAYKQHMTGKILVVDDDREMAYTLADLFRRNGYDVVVALSGQEAIEAFERSQNICVALVDLVMPVLDGIMVMEKIKEIDPEITIIIMTGFGTIQTAVEAIKRGAEDYILKPFDKEMILKKISRSLEVYRLKEKVAQLQEFVDKAHGFEGIVACSKKMREALDRAYAASRSDIPVLIVGETGTGKEVLACAIHRKSRRSEKPFVPVNCGALPKELMESELFGYKKGAFTGASHDHKGLFLAASGGTIFLDEISEMSKESQVKLLRVLQDGRIRPIGDTHEVQVDVRVISSTNRPLRELKGWALREDLYYRISTITIELPPLRDRREDIPLLVEHFLRKYGQKYSRHLNMEKDALELLLDYSFPGNVRELENIIEGITATADERKEKISVKDIKPLLRLEADSRQSPVYDPSSLSLQRLEKFAIEQALRISDGNKSKAAKVLGISRDSLYRKMRQYKISS